MCVCDCACVRVCVCMFMYVCVCVYVCMHVRVYVCMCACVYVCMYVHVCACVRACVCMYVCACVSVYVATISNHPHMELSTQIQTLLRKILKQKKFRTNRALFRKEPCNNRALLRHICTRTSFSFQMMTVRSSEQDARTCPNSGCAQSTFHIAALCPVQHTYIYIYVYVYVYV